LPVLDGDHPARGEGTTVADTVYHVEDRLGRIAGPQEIRVQGVYHPALDRAARSDQRLTCHLTAEHAEPILLRTAAADDVHLELFQVEDLEQANDGVRHGRLVAR